MPFSRAATAIGLSRKSPREERKQVASDDASWKQKIESVRLPQGFCYAAIILDVFTRRVVGYSLALSMDASIVHAALDKALAVSVPRFHHSDRGGQYCEKEYVAKLQSRGVKISMAETGVSVDNPFAESFNRTLKVEEVYLRDYRSFEEAERSIGEFIETVYNTRRLHSALGYRPPLEFEEVWKSRRLQKTEQALACVH